MVLLPALLLGHAVSGHVPTGAASSGAREWALWALLHPPAGQRDCVRCPWPPACSACPHKVPKAERMLTSLITPWCVPQDGS